MLSTLAHKVLPEHTCLLVINPQRDFLEFGGLAQREGLDVESAAAIIPRWRAFIDEARARGVRLVFVRTIHRQTRGSLLSPAASEPIARRLGVKALEDWGCTEGTLGSEFIPELAPLDSDYVLTKHRFNAFWDTPLDLVLRSWGIKTVIATGVPTHLCVESTLRTAFLRDYYVALVRDCTASYDEGAQAGAEHNIERFFGQVLDSPEPAGLWEKR